MSLPALTPDMALFIDLDGTLVEIAETPESIHIAPSLPGLLGRVAWRLDGALALVSGRDVATVDALLERSVTAVAGIHGLERRSATGTVTCAPLPHAALERVRRTLGAFAAVHPGVLLEDKGAALSLHYRGAPEQACACHEIVATVCAGVADELVLQPGKMVLELRARGPGKGDAVALFLAEAPFRGRRPVFVGDDLTDEAGFREANGRGGLSIRVGKAEASAALHVIDDVAAVHRWLERFAAAA